MSLNVGNPQSQPVNTFVQPNNGGFDMGLLGFGNPNPPQITQPVVNPQNNGGFNLLGNDFLGLGSSTNPPVQKQSVNNFNAQNIGLSFNQSSNPSQNQGFNWGVQSQVQQPQINQAQQNTNKFLAYENSQVQVWMNCIK